MATYAPITEDFSTGTVGSAVGAGYGQVDGKTGTGTAVIDSTLLAGKRAVLFSATANQSILRFDMAVDGDLDNGWIKWGTEVQGLLNTDLMVYAGNNATLGGSVRVNADNTVDLRNSASSTQWTSPALANGVYEFALKPTPGAWQFIIRQNGVIVAQTTTPLSNGFGVTALDTVRFGMCTATTGSKRLWWLRADTTTEPTGVASGNPQITATTKTWGFIDVRTSLNGTPSIAQAAGTTAAPVTSVYGAALPAGVWAVDMTGVTAPQVYDLTATDLGVTKTVKATLSPGVAVAKIAYFPNAALTAWV